MFLKQGTIILSIIHNTIPASWTTIPKQPGHHLLVLLNFWSIDMFPRKVDKKSKEMFKKFNQKSKGEHQKHLCNHDWVDRVRKWSDVDLVFHYSSSWPHERHGSFGFKSTAVPPPWPMIPTVDVIPGDDGLLGLWGSSSHFLHLKILVLISGPTTNPFSRRRLTSSRWTRNSARKIGPAQVRPDPFHDLQKNEV